MGKQKIDIPDDLTISRLAAFKTDAVALIENSNDITFIDKSLNKIDTAGVQLLLSLINEIITQKKSLSWEMSSSVLKESIKQLGLENSDFKKYFQNI
jgi:ABC-type transporter Mla MlaB component